MKSFRDSPLEKRISAVRFELTLRLLLCSKQCDLGWPYEVRSGLATQLAEPRGENIGRLNVFYYYD